MLFFLLLGAGLVVTATVLRGELSGPVRLERRDLWTWEGELDRVPYAIWGLSLFALKYNLDRFLAWTLMGKRWWGLDYLSGSPLIEAASEPRLYLLILAAALPFIWTGVVMTLRRLRSAGLPDALVVLFFAPVVNIPFFALLALMPRRSETPAPDMAERSPLASALSAVLIAALAALIATLVSVTGLKRYGLGLFVGLPFVLGLVSVLLHGRGRRRDFRECLTVSTAAVALAGLVLFAAAVEGVVCLLMAMPLAVPLAWMGAFVGWLIQGRRRDGGTPSAAVLLLGLPGLLGADFLRSPAPPLYSAVTSVEVDAPPARVWQHVVSFSELPPPESPLFKLGVAYPVRAVIEGKGVGALRRCRFSTGDFVEPITVWDEPRLLKFTVTSQPAPMREWSWAAVKAPHLDSFLVSEGGQFLLTPLPGGRTRLEGTTWYRHAIEPYAYWRPFSDAIIHRIHARVLAHVKALSEAA